MRKTSSRSLLILATVGTTVAFTLLGPTAQAELKPTVVATGLDNPRGIDFGTNGTLYVAEAGRGGDGPCFTGPEGDEVCWGTTGAITRVQYGKQSRILTGLPSIAAPNGSGALGPSDVALRGVGKMFFTVGLGADPAIREQLPEAGQEGNGWLLRSRGDWDTWDPWSQVADIAGFEATENPDGAEPDSNPNSVETVDDGRVVVDAGGNSLLWVTPDGEISTLAVFEDRQVDAPPSLGLPPGTQIPLQAVPTSVVRGPDGAYYVGQLTGFPFPQGAARVYRVVPGEEPTIYAEGFTNIIDLGFTSDGTLYVLEIAHNGLLSGDPTGALIRVDGYGTQHVVMSEGLTSPGGLAVRGSGAYVSNCGTCPGDGEVIRIPLR